MSATLALLIFPAALTLLVDQASKGLVLHRLAGEVAAARAGGAGRALIRVVHNPRVGFGLPAGLKPLAGLWAAAAGALLVLSVHYPQLQDPPTLVALGILLGGAAGNLIDLAVRGAIVDFIDVRFWPVFNLADGAIVCGAIWALVMWFG